MKNLSLLFKFLISLTVLALIPNSQSPADAAELLQTQVVFEGNDVVWGFDFVSENELILSLRSGELFYFNLNSKQKKRLAAPKASSSGQGGLLDVLVHRSNEKNYIYLTYAKKVDSGKTTALARGEFKNQSLVDLTTLFEAKVKSSSSIHFGSRLLIVDNQLFMTIGDRGERDFAQDLSYHNGKILRLTLDGKAFANNPFTQQSKSLTEIWTLGHRNPQGIAQDPASGKIYSCEFGPRGGDELNLIEKGKNYGWPVITYGREYYGPRIGTTHKEGMEQPVTYWSPSISPSGMVFYSGDKIKKWKNNLFLANLSGQHLRRLVLKNNKVISQEILFKNLNERIRQVRTGKDGYLYFSTDSGKIIKVSPSQP